MLGVGPGPASVRLNAGIPWAWGTVERWVSSGLGAPAQLFPGWGRAEATQLLLQGMGSGRQLGWQEVVMLQHVDLSSPSASEFLSVVSLGLSPLHRAAASQPFFWHPQAQKPPGKLCLRSGHWAEQRAELLLLLAPALGPSLQPSLLSSLTRCKLVSCV